MIKRLISALIPTSYAGNGGGGNATKANRSSSAKGNATKGNRNTQTIKKASTGQSRANG